MQLDFSFSVAKNWFTKKSWRHSSCDHASDSANTSPFCLRDGGPDTNRSAVLRVLRFVAWDRVMPSPSGRCGWRAAPPSHLFISHSLADVDSTDAAFRILNHSRRMGYSTNNAVRAAQSNRLDGAPIDRPALVSYCDRRVGAVGHRLSRKPTEHGICPSLISSGLT